MLMRLSKSLPVHPTLTLHGKPVQALGRNRRGALIWPVHGGNGEGEGGEGEGGAGGAGGAGDEKKFTQADIDRVASTRADQAERAARKKLLEDLGLPEGSDPKTVKKTLADAETARLAALGETERAKEEARLAKEAAEQAKAESDQEKATLQKERHDEKVQTLLTRAGVGVGEEFDKDEALRDKALARAAKLVEVQVGADSDDIRKAIGELKKDMPALFGKPATAPGGRGPGDGRPAGAPPAVRGKGESVDEAGVNLAQKLGWSKPKEKAS